MILAYKGSTSNVVRKQTRAAVYHFTKITKQEVQGSHYKQLVQKMAQLYGYQQYKSKSSLALLEIHHNFQIFQTGQTILDIGAGQRCGWTQLARKYTRNPLDGSVSSIFAVDKIELPHIEGVTCIKGDITNNQVQLEIIRKLENHKQFDLVLFDAVPEFSGNLFTDKRKLDKTLFKTLEFLYSVLNKGGSFVCKALLGAGMNADPSLQNNLKRTFQHVHTYRPLYLTKYSPVQYYVSKGFMLGEIYETIDQFSKVYNTAKTLKARQRLLNEYQQKLQGKYDLKTLLSERIRSFINQRLDEGVSEEQVRHFLSKDAYQGLDALIEQEIKKHKTAKHGSEKQKLELFRMQLKQMMGNPEADANKLLLDGLVTEEEMILEMQKVQDAIRSANKYEKQGRASQAKEEQLLDDNESYLQTGQEIQETVQYQYEHQDLDEDLPTDSLSVESTDAELELLKQKVPGFSEALEAIKSSKNSFVDEEADQIIKQFIPDFDAKVIHKKKAERVLQDIEKEEQDAQTKADLDEFRQFPNSIKHEKTTNKRPRKQSKTSNSYNQYKSKQMFEKYKSGK